MAKIIHGDCLDVMRGMADASVDAIVTDPPYGLGFMGVKWDTYGDGKGRGPSGRAVFDHVGGNHNPTSSADASRIRRAENRRFEAAVFAWACEMLRVAKPGAHLVACGGTRTHHRLMCAIEDAGWEIRDCLMWLYGSGFPKSHNGSWGGTALKPAWEPIILARKPLAGTVAANVAEHGTGALNIDGCRIGNGDSRTSGGPGSPSPLGIISDDAWNPTERRERPIGGRWPANVCLDEDAARLLDAQSGGRVAKVAASRFFYCAKASRREREAGLDGMPEIGAEERNAFVALPDPRMGREQIRRAAANHHPTVKPLALMRWLCRLVTPPGGTILDPFAGSGTTGCAAVLEGFGFTGIEREAEYVEIARRRIAHWGHSVEEQPLLLGGG